MKSPIIREDTEVIDWFIDELKEWRRMDNKTNGSAISLVSIVNEFLDDLEDVEEEDEDDEN